MGQCGRRLKAPEPGSDGDGESGEQDKWDATSLPGAPETSESTVKWVPDAWCKETKAGWIIPRSCDQESWASQPYSALTSSPESGFHSVTNGDSMTYLEDGKDSLVALHGIPQRGSSLQDGLSFCPATTMKPYLASTKM